MQKTTRAIFFGLFLGSCMAGCMPLMLDVPTAGIVLDETNAASTFGIAFESDAAIAWEATSDQSWLLLEQASGTGAAEVGLSVNADDPTLASPGTYRATVTVTTDGGSESFDVSYTVGPDAEEGEGESEGSTEGTGETEGETEGMAEPLEFQNATAVSTAYLPLNVDNTWRLSFADALDDVDAEGEAEDLLSLLPTDLGFSMTVTDRFAANGFEVAQVTLSSPEIVGPLRGLVVTGLLDLIGGVFGDSPDDEAPQTGGLAGAIALLGGGMQFSGLPMYIVGADDGHYLTFDIDRLQDLPASAGYIPLDVFFQFPGRVLAGAGSQVVADFEEEVVGEIGRVGFMLQGMAPALEAYRDDEAFTENLVALSLAFGEAFEDYDATDDAIVNAFARFLAASARGADDVGEFLTAFGAIGGGALADILALGDDLDAYLNTVESVDESIALLRAAGEEFTAFESGDLLVDGLANTLAWSAFGAADLVESLNGGEFSFDDPDVQELLIQVLGFVFVENGLDLLSEDPLAFLDRVILELERFEPTGPASTELRTLASNLLVAVRETIGGIVDASSEDADRIGSLVAFEMLASTASEFFGDYSIENEGNVLNDFMGLVATILDGSLDAIIEFQPALEEAATAASDLSETFETLGGDEINLLPLAQLFDDVEVFLVEYDDAQGDALAESLAIVAGGVADIVEAFHRLALSVAAKEFRAETGALSAFLPVDVYEGLSLGLGDILIGEDFPDVLVTVVEKSAGGDVTTTILARDVGPLLIGSVFTLDSASVDGTLYDRRACPEGVALDEIFTGNLWLGTIVFDAPVYLANDDSQTPVSTVTSHTISFVDTACDRGAVVSTPTIRWFDRVNTSTVDVTQDGAEVSIEGDLVSGQDQSLGTISATLVYSELGGVSTLFGMFSTTSASFVLVDGEGPVTGTMSFRGIPTAP